MATLQLVLRITAAILYFILFSSFIPLCQSFDCAQAEEMLPSIETNRATELILFKLSINFVGRFYAELLGDENADT